MPRFVPQLMLFTALLGIHIAQAQTSEIRGTASLSATFLDYQGLMTGKVTQFKNYEPGIALGAYGYATPWMNVSVISTFIPELTYPVSNSESIGSSLVDVNAMFQFKSNGSFLPEDAFVAPYISTGFGFNIASSNTGIYLPAALGVRFRITKTVSFQLESMYKQRLNSNFQHLQHSAGLVFAVSSPRRPVQKPEPKPVVNKSTSVVSTEGRADRDGDGIPDVEDACPDIKGLRLYMGCPNESKMPKNEIAETPVPAPKQEPVVEKAKPVPAQAPVSREPVAHITDLAVAQPQAVVSSNGIKAEDMAFLEQAMNNIYFEPNSNKLEDDAFPILDQLAVLLEKYPDYQLEVLGHADNTGDPKDNLVLSIQRAFNVKYYLANQKGVKLSRISSDGYSNFAPVAPSKGENGDRLNRRVEFRLVKSPSSGNTRN